jgi:beta-phosphoglucomutase
MVRAVIFDVDGVLVDSYGPHFRSWRELAAESGVTFTEAQFVETFGKTSRDIIRRVWGDDACDERRVRHLDDRKEALYRRIVSRDFPAMDGAPELIEALHHAGFVLAVGSSGPPENVELVLERLGKRALVAATVTGADVTRGKPDPQVFRIAAERLAAAPAECVVVEDAPDGVRAARAAGMAVVTLLSTGRREADFADASPDLIVASLRELSPDILRALR